MERQSAVDDEAMYQHRAVSSQAAATSSFPDAETVAIQQLRGMPFDSRLLSPQAMRYLQRSAGNAAVNQLLHRMSQAAHPTPRGSGLMQRLMVKLKTNAADPTRGANPVLITDFETDVQRPPTNLGHVQGDHTTAWTLIKEELAANFRGKDHRAALGRLFALTQVYSELGLQWAHELTDDIGAWSQSAVVPHDASELLIYNEKLEEFSKKYLEGRNAQPGAAYPRVHPKTPKVSVAVGGPGEAAAIAKIRNVAGGAQPIDFTNNYIKEAVIDLFDPPFTGALSNQAEQNTFIIATLVPAMSQHIISVLVTLADRIKAGGHAGNIHSLVERFVQKAAKDMDDQGIYGKEFSPQGIRNPIVTAIMNTLTASPALQTLLQ